LLLPLINSSLSGPTNRTHFSASTQIQKLKEPEVAGISLEEREELRTQLETLREELQQVLDAFGEK
jgi:hypothetical protein